MKKAMLGLSLVGASLATPAFAGLMTLSGTIYDHTKDEADFEDGISGLSTGMLADTLGGDGLPDYVGTGGYGAVDSAASFDNWWTDDKGATAFDLTLNETGAGTGIYAYNDASFFPIDNQLSGNEGNSHNYHFAMHLSGTTSFKATDTFNFTGDDDLWVYVDNKLVMDLGGVHGPTGSTVSGADIMSAWGLSENTDYDLDIFFAERHTTQSNFNITTSFHVDNTPVPEPASLALLGVGLAGLGLARRRRAR